MKARVPTESEIVAALQRTQGNVKEAALLLGVWQTSLSRRMRRMGLKRTDYVWPDVRTLGAWYVCGLSGADANAYCPDLTRDALHHRWARLKELPPRPDACRLRAGGLSVIVLNARPWLPFDDVVELWPWMRSWHDRSRNNLWQAVALRRNGKEPTGLRAFARLFLMVDDLAWKNRRPPLLLAGVKPRLARFYERHLGFSKMADIPEWKFAGNRPAVAMLRDYSRADRHSDRQGYWQAVADGKE